MRTHLVFIIAGALCLPLTYVFTRGGSILLSIAVVVVVSGLASMVAGAARRCRVSLMHAALAFGLGATSSELIVFSHYYLAFGYQDPKFATGAATSAVEFLAIVSIGAVVIILSQAFQDRKPHT